MFKINKNIFKSVPLLFALALFGFPLVASIPEFFEIESRPVSVVLRGFVILLSLIILVSFNKRLFANRYFLLFSSFWFLYTLRIIYSTVTQSEIINSMGNFEFLSYAFGISLIPSIALFNSLHTKNWDQESIFNTTYFILFIATLANVYLSLTLGLQQENTTGRLNTSVLNPISQGHIGVSLILLSIYPFFSASKYSTKRVLLFSLGIIVGIITAISAASKGPIVSLVVALFIFLIFRVKPKKALSTVFIGIISLFFTSLTIGFLKDKFDITALDRLSNIINILEGRAADQSTDIRITLYSNAWDQFLSSPLWGSGIVEKVSGGYPHNVIIESFMSTGLFGGIIFTLLCALVVQKSAFLIRKHYTLSWVGLLAIQYLVGSMFSGSLFGSYTMWVTMAFTFAVYSYYRKQSQSLS